MRPKSQPPTSPSERVALMRDQSDLESCATSPIVDVRRAVAASLFVWSDTLVSLAGDEDTGVREAVAKNRLTPLATLELLCDDEQVCVQHAAARQIKHRDDSRKSHEARRGHLLPKAENAPSGFGLRRRGGEQAGLNAIPAISAPLSRPRIAPPNPIADAQRERLGRKIAAERLYPTVTVLPEPSEAERAGMEKAMDAFNELRKKSYGLERL